VGTNLLLAITSSGDSVSVFRPLNALAGAVLQGAGFLLATALRGVLFPRDVRGGGSALGPLVGVVVATLLAAVASGSWADFAGVAVPGGFLAGVAYWGPAFAPSPTDGNSHSPGPNRS